MSSKELYRLTEGTVVWTFTSSNEAEVYNGETYTPRVVGRSEISDKAQLSKATVDVTFALLDDIAQHLLKSAVDAVVRLDIYSKDEAGVYRNEWRGRLQSISPDGKNNKATFENIFSANRRYGARPVYQRTCRHAVYGPGCRLNLVDFLTPATVTGMSADGLTLQVPGAAAQASGYYRAGVLLMSDGTMRYIASHVGPILTLVRASDTLRAQFTAGSASVSIAPGCDQTEPTCFGRFNNLYNHGGWSKIPLTDPIGGAPIV